MAKITCKVPGCPFEGHFILDHLLEAHGMTGAQYEASYPGAPTVSDDLLKRHESSKGRPRRSHPPTDKELTVEFGGVSFPVNWDVPADACLPLPYEYKVPQYGNLGRDIQHAAVALRTGRSAYVWGLPGSGKDAFYHAFSAQTRTPAAIFTVRPGEDIQGWFFVRSFNAEGTAWEEGDFLRKARDGYLTKEGRRLPYMLVISDFDRSDRSQAEAMRLVLDSISGRIMGPAGKTYNVLPGTIVVATANTSGAGDSRGRMISANPLDASILDRFERTFEFHWMDWKDEEPICRAKFPLLVERAPDCFKMVGNATNAMRQAIANEDLYTEFSHRAVCAWLGHAQDLILYTNEVNPKALLKKAARAVLDRMPDEETRLAARRLIDPHLAGGALDAGDTSHIKDGKLVEGWD
jgi:MoxR-like ATPase